jgi:transposase-like protein
VRRRKTIPPKENKFNSLLSLSEHFPTEQSCRQYLEKQRWDGNPVCPHCDDTKVYKFKDGRLFRCAKYRKQFTVTVGTIFEDSHISLRKWFLAIYLVTAHKKGISSLQLSRDLRVTQKPAWFMLHRI